MKRKRKRSASFEELMANRYGRPLPPKRSGRSRYHSKNNFVLSKSMDNSEVLPQVKPKAGFEEYVVQSSLDENKFEEYVVASSVQERKNEEYVAMQSIPSAPAEPKESNPYESKPVPVATEYVTDILNPLGNAPDPALTSEGNIQKTQTPNTQAQSLTGSLLEEFATEKSKPQADETDFIEDMKAILSGEKVYDKDKKGTVPRSQSMSQQNKPEPPAPEKKNEHEIFDRIAQSMQYANAYDLGTVELENRFSDFDRIAEFNKRQEEEKKKSQSKQSTTSESPQSVKPDSTDFLHDLDAIREQQKENERQKQVEQQSDVPENIPTNSTEYPPVPSGLRPYSATERAQVFGSFPYEADPSTFGGDGIKVLNNWKDENIVTVNIPQLNGKKIEGHTITNGSMQFHKQGADALRALWSEWESAGLLDKVITFDGSYAPRFIRHTQDRNPRPLSNHAWGTAFDINASSNVFGQEPALVGQPGSVRELVQIANKHGFFWGGHFHSNKDGMHFELGKTTS